VSTVLESVLGSYCGFWDVVVVFAVQTGDCTA